MNRLQKTTLIFATLLLPTMAEDVMKITLSDEVSDENLSTLSKIVFTENTMVAGATYNLDDIEKIEFYDDGDVGIENNSHSNSSVSSLSKGQIGFSVTASHLSLILPQASNLSVSLYSLSGRKVAELFKGATNAGALNLNLTNNGLATGIYSVVIKTSNTLFVRKLIIK